MRQGLVQHKDKDHGNVIIVNKIINMKQTTLY